MSTKDNRLQSLNMNFLSPLSKAKSQLFENKNHKQVGKEKYLSSNNYWSSLKPYYNTIHKPYYIQQSNITSTRILAIYCSFADAAFRV